MIRFLFLSLLFLTSFAIKAQIFKGRVTDSSSGEPLAYCNIGVRGKTIGGISNSEGYFIVDISKASPGDKIAISYLGYEPKQFDLADIDKSKEYNVQLTPTPHQLNEVVITDKQQKVNLGNTSQGNRFTGWGYDSSSVGRARGLVIYPKPFPVIANEFKIHINENTFDSVRFRLNIFVLNKSDTVELQLPENIFFTTSGSNRWVTVDIRRHKITLSDTIIAAVEWLDAWGPKRKKREDSHQLTVSLGKLPGLFYLREKPFEQIDLKEEKQTPSMYFVCTY